MPPFAPSCGHPCPLLWKYSAFNSEQGKRLCQAFWPWGNRLQNLQTILLRKYLSCFLTNLNPSGISKELNQRINCIQVPISSPNFLGLIQGPTKQQINNFIEDPLVHTEELNLTSVQSLLSWATGKWISGTSWRSFCMFLPSWQSIRSGSAHIIEALFMLELS